jgi:hypothetical protein
MTRSQRLALSSLFALFPCMLGFKGCYFGNDDVPLGSNAADGGADGLGNAPDGPGGPGSRAEAGGEGGGSGENATKGKGEGVFVFQLQARSAAWGAAGSAAEP